MRKPCLENDEHPARRRIDCQLCLIQDEDLVVPRSCYDMYSMDTHDELGIRSLPTEGLGRYPAMHDLILNKSFALSQTSISSDAASRQDSEDPKKVLFSKRPV